MRASHRLAALARRSAEGLLGADVDRADGRCRLAPEWLVLVVNNACNLRCRMCDVGLGESGSVFWAHMIGTDRRAMSLAMLETILDQAAAFRPRPRIGLAFTEPLIHPQIVELCRAVVARGFFCSITTNGSTLPRHAAALVAAGLDELNVSVDGPEEVHDRIRGVAGSFRRLYAGLERVLAAKGGDARARPHVRLSYTITDANTTAMPAFVRAVAPLRPAALCFSHLNFITAGMAAAHNAAHPAEFAVARSNLGEIEPGGIDLDALWAALGELKREAGRTRRPTLTIVPDLASRAALETYYRAPLAFVGGRRCTDPWKMMMVRTDGSVIAAHSRCYDVPLGNLAETPLTDLWNNARARFVRQTLRAAGGTLTACARCCGVIGKAPATAERRARA